MDAWCSPERIRQAHLPDEVSYFTSHFRPSRLTLPTLPGPIEAESPAMPSHDRFRPDEDERRTPAEPQVQQPSPQQAVHLRESNAPTLRPSKHVYLVAEGKNLQLQGRPALEVGAEGTEEGKESGKHWSDKLSSRSEPTSIISMRTEFLAGTGRRSGKH